MNAAAPTGKANGFGALRLLFASMVILSHSPEMATGDRSRELLTRLFGTISFGDLAVDCFFLISGYLITGSMLGNPRRFLWRRGLRIYPAFLVCTAFCLFFVAPFAGVDLTALPLRNWVVHAGRALLLQPPLMDNVFIGSHHPALNGSMWTIAYEFRCYLLTYLLGRLALLRSPILPILCGAVLIAFVVSLQVTLLHLPSALTLVIGEPQRSLRLFAAYLVGASFVVATPPLRADLAWIAVAALAGLMLFPALAEPALFLLGGYALFTAAFRFSSGWFRTLNSSTDISYGLYLYAFPIGKLLFWYYPSINVWLHVVITLLLSMFAGWISWQFVEKGFLALGRRKDAPAESTGARLSGDGEMRAEVSSALLP